MMAIQKNMPMMSRICQILGRSRYSHCWDNRVPSGITPKIESASLTSDPTTTNASAASRPYASQCCPFGSRRVMNGVRKIPAASNALAVHSSDSCKCQVRARLNGRISPMSIP